MPPRGSGIHPARDDPEVTRSLTEMISPDRTYDRVRFHRGSRGFAAFVTGLNGAILLGLALFVTPALGLDQPASSWFVILAGGAGIGHLVAVVGLIRGRAWSGALVGYLAAAGIAVAGFGALAAVTGLYIFGAQPGTAVGFFVWMIGSWLVATRYALRPFTYARPAPRQAHRRVERPAPDARPQTGLRKIRRPAATVPARPARPLPTPRIVHPVPPRVAQPALIV
jgi:hypothetical protein